MRQEQFVERHKAEWDAFEHWLQALRSDRRLIFTAAAQAQKAADYLLADRVPTAAAQALQAAGAA